MKGFTKGKGKGKKFIPTSRKKQSLSKEDLDHRKRVIEDIDSDIKSAENDHNPQLAKQFKERKEKILKEQRGKQSLDIPRAKLNFNKGLLTNEANELEEVLELRKEDRERIHEQELIMDKLTKKMFNIIFDFENGHNDDISLDKYNDLKLDFQNLLVEFEDASNERDQVMIGLNDDNKNLVRKIDKVQDILFDIGN